MSVRRTLETMYAEGSLEDALTLALILSTGGLEIVIYSHCVRDVFTCIGMLLVADEQQKKSRVKNKRRQ